MAARPLLNRTAINRPTRTPSKTISPEADLQVLSRLIDIARDRDLPVAKLIMTNPNPITIFEVIGHCSIS